MLHVQLRPGISRVTVLIQVKMGQEGLEEKSHVVLPTDVVNEMVNVDKPTKSADNAEIVCPAVSPC